MAVQAESIEVPQKFSMTEELPHDDKEPPFLLKLRRRRNVKKSTIRKDGVAL